MGYLGEKFPQVRLHPPWRSRLSSLRSCFPFLLLACLCCFKSKGSFTLCLWKIKAGSLDYMDVLYGYFTENLKGPNSFCLTGSNFGSNRSQGMVFKLQGRVSGFRLNPVYIETIQNFLPLIQVELCLGRVTGCHGSPVQGSSAEVSSY